MSSNANALCGATPPLTLLARETWNVSTEDNLNIPHARQVLDELSFLFDAN
jgi:hypothetical protein